MKQFQPGIAPHERRRILEENAAKVEQTTYQRPLSEDELSERRETLADNCIKMNIKNEELAKIKDQFKKELQPLVDSNKTVLTEIKTKQATVDGKLFYMPNYDESMMEIYDENGMLIIERRLRPDEKQGALFNIAKTAN